MIQGGGFEPGMNQKPTGAPIANEANNGLKNDTLHAGDGAHLGAALGDGAVLHQRRRQRLPRTSSPRRRRAGAMRSSAGSSRARTSSTRSRRCSTGSQGGHDDVPLDDVTITARDRRVLSAGAGGVVAARAARAPLPTSRRAAGTGARSTSSRDLHLAESTPRAFDACGATTCATPTPMRSSSSATCSRSGSATTRADDGFEARCAEVLAARRAPACGRLHGRQPRLPARRRDARGDAASMRLRRPDPARRLRRARAAVARRRAVPGRRAVPALPRACAAPAWQRAFLARPLAERRAIGARHARRSERRKRRSEPRRLGRRRRRPAALAWMRRRRRADAGPRPHPPPGEPTSSRPATCAMC